MSNHKVYLRGPDGTVVFEASAPLSEDRQASYQGFNIVHLPTAIVAYQNTTGRKFGITGKLVSRTAKEAGTNAKYLDYVRKWILPDFGGTGATPPILKLTAYKNNNIKELQVVITSYAWTFPDEVDYIWDGAVPMPVIGTLQVSLEEVYSAEQVTARKWRIKPTSGSGFENKGEAPKPPSPSSFSIPDKSSRAAGISQSLGGALSSYPGSRGGSSAIPTTIAGMIAGNLTRGLGAKLMNSPAVQALTKQLPPIVSNVFVSGANILIGSAGKAVTTGVSSLSATPSVPNFNRSDTAPPAPYIPPDP